MRLRMVSAARPTSRAQRASFARTVRTPSDRAAVVVRARAGPTAKGQAKDVRAVEGGCRRMTSATTPGAKSCSGTMAPSVLSKPMRLVLASASPRRAELLTTAGFTFEVRPADVDETPRLDEAPASYALRVARDKAAAAVHRHSGDACILAADTVVVID